MWMFACFNEGMNASEKPVDQISAIGGVDVAAVARELESIRDSMLAETAELAPRLEAVNPTHGPSARNLLHYLALRRHDLRPLQTQLARLGLSSLGRAESHTVATIDAVLEILHRLLGQHGLPHPAGSCDVDFPAGQRLLAEHTEALFGPPTDGRDVRIMVTMPTEAAHEYTLVHDLLEQGMNCMRINCAHDDASTWSAMIANLRRAEESLGKPCRVVMDLAGPKLRTGPLAAGAAVARVRPARDVYGRVIAPARVWLTASGHAQPPPSSADGRLAVPATWLARLRLRDRIALTDARGAKRELVVVDATEAGAWAESVKTIYFVPDTVLTHRTADGRAHDASVGGLAALESRLVLRTGDLLILTRNLEPGRPATSDAAGRVLTPATIGCTLPEFSNRIRTGEPIWFDDGKIGGAIEKIEPDRLYVRITHALPFGSKLGADKGINLPQSNLDLSAMTPDDVESLAFAAEHADLIELSFANSAHDVESLEQHLARLGERRPAIVLKVETRAGFEHLPDMLLSAMQWPSCGVMIARGDLAVECGFERLAEVQEEILWICEAAHVPVIWATQVLETLAKKGMASRAEITDAAMSHRAECVMLNKGPHVRAAVRVLDDILRRMQAHQAKKRAMLRELRLAHCLP